MRQKLAENIINNLISHCEAESIPFKLNEPLSSYTTFKIGGSCDMVAFPSSTSQINSLIKHCEKEEITYRIFGKGANLLISDYGINGIVIITEKNFSKITTIDETTFKADAGASISALCRYAYENSLTGLEFAWGIPGTFGGAIYMNAGAYGGEFKDVILSASYIDEDGIFKTLSNEECHFSYRHSFYSGKNLFITGGIIKLNKGEKTEIKARMDEVLKKRKDKQPLEFPSAGSTFKRPEGAFAAALIEQCGLKGVSVGGACVSEKHSGFIVNKGGATCEDVLSLIEVVRKKVLSETGYELECEVEIIKD